ncbi:MAG: hypothetical protein IT296_07060, partial [Anaerolineae bacterium]|nr:hypothetical protein [Anaerolineae bacterium]
RPAVSHIQLLDEVDIRETAKLGEAAVEAALPELKRVTGWTAKLVRMLRRV